MTIKDDFDNSDILIGFLVAAWIVFVMVALHMVIR